MIRLTRFSSFQCRKTSFNISVSHVGRPQCIVFNAISCCKNMIWRNDCATTCPIFFIGTIIYNYSDLVWNYIFGFFSVVYSSPIIIGFIGMIWEISLEKGTINSSNEPFSGRLILTTNFGKWFYCWNVACFHRWFLSKGMSFGRIGLVCFVSFHQHNRK